MRARTHTHTRTRTHVALIMCNMAQVRIVVYTGGWCYVAGKNTRMTDFQAGHSLGTMKRARKCARGPSSHALCCLLTARHPLAAVCWCVCLLCVRMQVQKGQFVCDPYMGTGSIGVAAAHYDAYVLGLDIDPRVVKLVGGCM